MLAVGQPIPMTADAGSLHGEAEATGEGIFLSLPRETEFTASIIKTTMTMRFTGAVLHRQLLMFLVLPHCFYLRTRAEQIKTLRK
jgi:hypothetical protein